MDVSRKDKYEHVDKNTRGEKPTLALGYRSPADDQKLSGPVRPLFCLPLQPVISNSPHQHRVFWWFHQPIHLKSKASITPESYPADELHSWQSCVSAQGFDRLRSGQRRIGSNSGATSTSMLRATPGCRRISPVRSRVSTIW